MEERTNKIKISGDIKNSNVYLNQAQDSFVDDYRNKHVRLMEIEGSEKVHDGGKIAEDSGKFAFALLISGVGFASDLSGVGEYLNLPKGLIIGFCAIVICAAFFKYGIYFMFGLSGINKERKFFSGLSARINSDGDYVFSQLHGKCIYPYCTGDLKIVEAPVKERVNHRYIAVCSKDQKHHTYSIDNNDIAYPYKVDWGDNSGSA